MLFSFHSNRGLAVLSFFFIDTEHLFPIVFHLQFELCTIFLFSLRNVKRTLTWKYWKNICQFFHFSVSEHWSRFQTQILLLYLCGKNVPSSCNCAMTFDCKQCCCQMFKKTGDERNLENGTLNRDEKKIKTIFCWNQIWQIHR